MLIIRERENQQQQNFLIVLVFLLWALVSLPGFAIAQNLNRFLLENKHRNFHNVRSNSKWKPGVILNTGPLLIGDEFFKTSLLGGLEENYWIRAHYNNSNQESPWIYSFKIGLIWNKVGLTLGGSNIYPWRRMEALHEMYHPFDLRGSPRLYFLINLSLY